jgi:hypothetical protein
MYLRSTEWRWPGDQELTVLTKDGEENHSRLVKRNFLLVDLIAIGCAYLCGAIIVPNIFNLAIWVLDILGRFLYLCGRGEALLKILLANEANRIQMLATDYEPSTLERIRALEALLRAEYKQMAKLDLEVPKLPELLQKPPKKLLK